MIVNPVIYGNGQQVFALQFFFNLKFKGKKPSQMGPDLLAVQIDLCKMSDRFKAQNNVMMFKKRFRK